MYKSYQIAKIRPNPFRNIERYPVRREKIEALKESYRQTGFWGNLVARKVNGQVEIAYGYHRLVALQEELGPRKTVELIIRDLTDEAMLKMMDRENMVEWGTSAVIEQETIRAIVQAFSEGKIKLPTPARAARMAEIRYAPSFIKGGPRPDPQDTRGTTARVDYTAATVASFLGRITPRGRPSESIELALAALELIEVGILEEADFEVISTAEAGTLIEETRKAKRSKELTARLHEKEAERAEKDLRDAERAAQRAKDAKARAAAGERQQQAKRRRVAAQKQQAKFTAQARQEATAVGKAISKQFRKGEIGRKQASIVALGIRTKKSQPIPDIEDFARKIVSDLGRIFDEKDIRVEKIKALIKHREHLSSDGKQDVAAALKGLSERALGFRQQVLSSTRKALQRR